MCVLKNEEYNRNIIDENKIISDFNSKEIEIFGECSSLRNQQKSKHNIIIEAISDENLKQTKYHIKKEKYLNKYEKKQPKMSQLKNFDFFFIINEIFRLVIIVLLTFIV